MRRTVEERALTRAGRTARVLLVAFIAAVLLGHTALPAIASEESAPADDSATTTTTVDQQSSDTTSARDESTATVIVKLVRGLTSDEQDDVVARNGGTVTSSIPALRLHAIDVPASDLENAVARYSGDSQVASAEADQIRQVEGDPSDQGYAEQWALPQIGWPEAFGTVTPPGTSTIAILDTGVDASDADLDGLLTDGYSALDNGSATDDPNGHGTAMATIAAAATDNDAGIAGVAYAGTSIMPVKVLDAEGLGWDSDIIEGVVWAADHGADVILMSFSNPGFSENLQDAVDYAWSKGAVLVAATGNDASATPTYPAGMAKVVGVAATDRDDTLWAGSNHGADTFIAAPGVGIATTNGAITGTSASAAIVAGAAALVGANDPGATPGVIVGRLARNTDPAGTVAETGNGRLNLARALADASTDAVVPVGAASADGGPIVGPYKIAANGTVSGTVKSSASPFAAISGATVTITCAPTACNAASFSGTTNALGEYSIVVNWSSGTRQGTVSVSASGFTGQSSPWGPISNLGTTTVNFSLVPSCAAPSISAQPTGATKTVGESASFSVTASGTAPLTYQWKKGTTDVGTSSSTYSIPSVTTADAGSYTVVVTNGCGASVTSSAASLVVNKATPVVTWADPADIVYGTALSATQLNATAGVSGSFTYTPAAGTVLNAGSTQPLAVEFTPTDTTNYNTANKTVHINVTPRPITATADAKSRIYGDADPALTYQVTGTLVGSDGFTGALTRAAGANVGSYAIQQGTLALSSNYELTFVGANLTITARPITVTADAQGKAYGDVDPVLSHAVTTGSLVGSDSLSGSLDRVVGEDVGSYAIQQGTLTAGTNYTLTYVGANLTIAARAVTVTADAKGKTYGDADPALTYQVTSGSLKPGDAFTGSLTRAAGENVGSYAIQQGTLALNGNYALTFVGANLTIAVRPVTVTAAAKAKDYGNIDPALTYSITSGTLAGGDGFTGALIRAAGEDVGTYAITQGTLALSSNYALTFVGADLTIGAREVTVTADPQTKVYGETDPTLTYDITDGSLAAGDSFTGALTRATGENVGTYAITQGTLALDSNYSLTYVGDDLTITARPVTVTADAKAKTYGDSDPVLTFQITSGSLAFSDSFSGALTRAAGEAVGPYAIQQSTLALDGNYDLSYVGADLTISQRPITVTADGGGKTYGDADPALTYQYTGTLAAGDSFAGELSRDAGEGVGTYQITQGTLALSSNYALTYVPANLSITLRSVTVSADPQSKTYGDADPALTYAITSGTLAFSDSFTGALTRAAGENIGAYAIGQGTLSLGGNYNLSYVGADLTIGTRAVTATADPQTKVYGDADPALTYQITSGSLAFSDAFSGALTRGAGEDVGSYAIGQGTLALNTNYVLTFVPANLSITARPVTVTADPQTKVYGDADPALTYQITSGSLGFSDAFSGALTRGAGEDVGSYAIGQGTLALTTNYVLTFVPANLSITARPVTVSADPQTKVYGDADPALTYQITSGSLGFSDAFSGALTRAPGEDVGPYAISQGTLALSANYDLTYVGANLSITARPVTVSADPQSKVYGDADPALTYQITSGSLGFSDAFSGALTRAPGEDVGPYAISQGTLALSANYSLTYVGANLSITARPLTVSADPQSKTYGDADPSLTYQITSGTLAFSDTFSGALSRVAGENVGTHAVTQGSLTLGANYNLSYVGADLTIAARPVTVTADAKSKTYGDSDPALTYQISDGSLAFADAFSGNLSRVAGENVGTYAIKQGSLALGTNYDLSYVGADLTINARPITITADAKSKTYGNPDPALTHQVTSGSLAFTDTVSGALTRAAGEDVGSYAITQGTLAVSANYDLTFVGANLTINARPITVAADAKSKTYGEADPALTYQISDGSLAFSDSLSGALTRAAGEDVGSYPIQQDTVSAGTNYALTYVGANLTITARPVTITADPKSKAWAAPDPTLTYQITAGTLVAGDVISGGLARDGGEAPGSYPIRRGTVTPGTNYAVTYVGADLTIGSLTITGFYTPIDMTTGATTVWNVVKAGSTVPLKFNVYNAGVEQTDVSIVKSVTRTTTSCTSGTADVVPYEATGGTTFRYDATERQFIFNWAVPKAANACFRLVLTTADGSTLTGAYFKTK